MNCDACLEFPVVQAEQNKLVMAGALTEPVDGALFIFRSVGRAASPSLRWFMCNGLRSSPFCPAMLLASRPNPLQCAVCAPSSACRNVSKEDIEAFVAADPYVANGLVPSWGIRPYMVVAGDSS